MTSKLLNKPLLFIMALFGVFIGCTEHVTPRPKGYFRIELPEKNYQSFTPNCPMTLQIPTYSRVETVSEHPDSCWFNLYMPRHKARLHMTYVAVSGDLTPLLEDAYTFAFKHEMKANAIKRTTYTNDSSRVFGMLYDLTGNVASPLQFYVTDSTSHFLRGSLYFMHSPNADSIAPVLEYVRADALHLIETLKWQNPTP